MLQLHLCMSDSESSILAAAGVLLLLIIYKTFIKNERLANDEYQKGFPRCVRLLDTVISIAYPLLVSGLYLLSTALRLESLAKCLRSHMLVLIIVCGANQLVYTIVYHVFSYDRSYSSGNYHYTDTSRKSIGFRKWFVDIACHLGSLLIFAASVMCSR